MLRSMCWQASARVDISAVRTVATKLHYEELSYTGGPVGDGFVEVIVFNRQGSDSMFESVTVLLYDGVVSALGVTEVFAANGENSDVVADAITQTDPHAFGQEDT